MPTSDDLSAAALRVAGRMGLTRADAEALALVGGLTAQGIVTAQVAPPPSGEGTDALRRALSDMFDEGLLAWKTSKGWIHTHDARNPATGRRFGAATLFMTSRAVSRYGGALHALLLEPVGDDRKRPRVEGITLEAYLASLSRGMAPAPDDDGHEGPSP